ncbi:MAG: AMP-binding protein [Hyphomonadaceae bacterium]|nr:AMP-binding protein [Hyphomonadaceae bacterium]
MQKKTLPSWASSTPPSRDQCVLRYVLRHQAETRPNDVFVVFENGAEWTYAQACEEAGRAGAWLRALGVAKGDRVLSWLPTGPDALRVWFGANWIGAVYVPINPAYKGGLLEHVISNSGARVIFTTGDLADRLIGIGLGQLAHLVLVDNAKPTANLGSLRLHAPSDLPLPVSDSDDFDPEIEPWDEQSIIFTSGTTGPSKGVLSSYCHLATAALVGFEERDKEGMRYLITLPLFHVGGTIGVYGMLLLGRSCAMTSGFRTQDFWDIIRRTRATCCTLLGAMATFLLKTPVSSSDRRHSLDWVFMVPLLENAEAFRKRFGVTILTMFNMTEVSCPILSEKNPAAAGSCGRPRLGIEARLVDENDLEVERGAVGELILRSNRPWSMMHGYNAMPEASAKAWRNGWFHTGDGFRQDARGNFYFVDRMKDAIRRRGENISSFEVEAEVLNHPLVRECAAVGVPSEYGEDEVMIVVSPAEAQSIDPAQLVLYLKDRMPYFMVPRFVRILSDLPKTPTAKVLKAELRNAGVTADTWDREAAGIQISRKE